MVRSAKLWSLPRGRSNVNFHVAFSFEYGAEKVNENRSAGGRSCVSVDRGVLRCRSVP